MPYIGNQLANLAFASLTYVVTGRLPVARRLRHIVR